NCPLGECDKHSHIIRPHLSTFNQHYIPKQTKNTIFSAGGIPAQISLAFAVNCGDNKHLNSGEMKLCNNLKDFHT
ncbi:MAG: hypothetical protein WC374_02040, partial [Phycisphaerae bacterium]